MEETGITEPKKKPRGKSFEQGYDPRRNIKGHKKKGETLAEKFRNALEEQVEGQPEGYTNLDYLIDLAVGEAKAGNWSPVEYVLARAYGKMPDRIETSNINKNYDFTNLSLEERMKLHEQLKNADTTVPSDNPDTE